MANGVAGLDLSQELLAVLPSDPQEQLDMARRITARAVALRLSTLEAETGKLRQKLTAKEHVILGLQERMSHARTSSQETDAKILLSKDEQARLVNEKSALAIQVKKLLRDAAKLETFKRTVVHSLHADDRPSGDGVGNRGGGPSNFAIWKASQLAESNVTRGQIIEDDGQSENANSLNAKSPKNNDEAAVKSVRVPTPSSGPSTPKLGSTRTPGRGTPRLTPTGSPKPLLPDFQIPTSLPTSRSGSRPSSPNRGSGQPRTIRLDAKEFFRQARSRLTYEQFSSFLVNIKELNSHKQTREEALGKAEGIFGPENKDLCSIFESILNRHLPS